jgi:hypothetical protein
MSHTIETAALIGSNPLGFLAALGLLKSLSAINPSTRLRFLMRDDWVAEFSGTPFSNQSELLDWLRNWIEAKEQDQRIDWADDLRVSVAEHRELLTDALQRSQDPALEVISTQIADGAVDKSKGLVKPTLFYMVSGQQSFLASLKEVLADVRKQAHKRFTEALFGPWAMSAKAHGLGLDPAGERMHALRSRAPSKDKAGSISAATWLAFIAMPLFPTLSEQAKLRTTGFHKTDGKWQFRWPICTEALSLATWTTLLQTQSWTNPQRGKLRNGIVEVFQSTRHEFGQGYGVFRPARRVSKEIAQGSKRR